MNKTTSHDSDKGKLSLDRLEWDNSCAEFVVIYRGNVVAACTTKEAQAAALRLMQS
jgi:hypothetical protein